MYGPLFQKREAKKPTRARMNKLKRRVMVHRRSDSFALALCAARLIVTQMQTSRKNS